MTWPPRRVQVCWRAPSGALLSLLLAGSACGGEDKLGPRIPAAIVVVPNEPRVPVRQTRQLTATVVDAAGRAVEGEPLIFTSGSPEVLTVSPTGLLTSVGPLGPVEILVASGELTTHLQALVVLPPSAIVVEPATLALQRGQAANLFVTVTNELSQPVTANLTFRSTAPTVAAVDAGGLVTARENGSAAIVVSSPEREDVEVPVTVAQIPTRIGVTPTNVALAPGGQQSLTTVVYDAVDQPMPGAAVAYTSSAPAVATVSSSGLVRAVANGSAVITVASGDLSVTVGVFVGAVPPGTILATVELTGAPWGVRTRGSRYFVTGIGGMVHGGQGTGFDFPVSLGIGGQTLDIDVDAAGTRAYVASTGNAGTTEGIGVIDLATGAVVDVLPGTGSDALLAVALSPDESRLFIGTGSSIEQIDLGTGVVTPTGIAGSVTAFSRHPSLPRLYANLGYASVAEIDAATGVLLRSFFPSDHGVFGSVQGTVVAPDGSRVYAALEGGDLVSWDLATGEFGPTLVGGGGFGLAISPDGELLYVTRWTDVLIVDRESLALLRTVTVGGSLRRIGVRADGVALAASETGFVTFLK